MAPSTLAMAAQTTPVQQNTASVVSGIRTSLVSFRANGIDVSGYLAQPAGAGPFPGVIVLHEWWGLDDRIRAVANRLAAEGIIVLAPDLYRGQVISSPDEVRQMLQTISAQQALEYTQAAVDHLVGQLSTVSNKAGLLAFSFGDRLAVKLAQMGANIGAAAVLYGGTFTAQEWATVGGAAEQHYLQSTDALAKQHLMEFPAPVRASRFGNRVVDPMILYSYYANVRPENRYAVAAGAWQAAIGWLTRTPGLIS